MNFYAVQTYSESVDRSSPEGQTFELFAFVNDVEANVNEGLDGLEHMYVGRKHIKALLKSCFLQN